MTEGSRHCIHRVSRSTCPECGAKDDLRQRIAELEAEAAALKAALRQVDRVMTPDGEVCPWCNGVPGYGETGHKSDCLRQAALSGEAGKRLLEAVRVLESLAGCDICGERHESYHQRRWLDHSESEYDQARATLRDLGVLEGE